MRNPKTMYLLTVIVGVLLLGVAYAAIQNITLTINGTATATPDQGNFKVKFTGKPTSTVSGNGTAALNVTGDTTATMNVSNMTTLGDTVTSKFTVINESIDLTAYLSTSVAHTNTEYFEVTTTIGTTELAPQNATTILSVVVKLIKTPISQQTDTINVQLVASPTEISGEMISFTIDGKRYTVTEGTTWTTWFEANGWYRAYVGGDFEGVHPETGETVSIFEPYLKDYVGWSEGTVVILDSNLYNTPIVAGEYYTTTVHS